MGLHELRTQVWQVAMFGHVHAPDWHTSLEPQALPQLPQFAASELTSTHLLPQQTVLPVHAGLQTF